MKIVFFSLEAGRMGGVASVNESLTQALRDRGHEIRHLYLRAAGKQAEGTVLRPDRPWEFTEGSAVKDALKAKKPFLALSLLKKRRSDLVRYRKDLVRARAFLRDEKPDFIVLSHYLLLGGIPEEFLSRSLYHVHRAAEEALSHKAHKKALFDYNGKIGFLFLSRGSADVAKKEGLRNCYALYNPLSHYPETRAVAETRKTVSVITRFSPEKALPTAVSLLKRAMDRLPDPSGFSVRFWGEGEDEDRLLAAIGNDPRFAVMGKTSDPFAVLADSRFTVNTSPFEGFSISVLEALAAGVPVVAFHFGAAAEEEILHGKTGFLIPQGDEDAFTEALVRLFTEDGTVREMSLAARDFARAFTKEEIALSWERLLSSLPLDKSAEKG